MASRAKAPQRVIAMSLERAGPWTKDVVKNTKLNKTMHCVMQWESGCRVVARLVWHHSGAERDGYEVEGHQELFVKFQREIRPEGTSYMI